MLDAHNSNVGKGELVNCSTGGKEFNDIHIELVKSASEDDACNIVSAEMSPHMRPESWSDLPTLTIKRPVRVTGPLLFDGSHRPTGNGPALTEYRSERFIRSISSRYARTSRSR